MTPTEKKPSRFYPKEERVRVRKTIAAMNAGGHSYSAIAKALNEAGMRTAGGKEFTTDAVSKYLWIIRTQGLGARRRRPVKRSRSRVAAQAAPQTAKPSTVGPKVAKPRALQGDMRLAPTVVGILTDPSLSDAQKVRMLCAYGNLE